MFCRLSRVWWHSDGMVAATSEGLERISAERRARWLQQRRRRRVVLAVLVASRSSRGAAALALAAAAAAARRRRSPPAPTRRMPVRPLARAAEHRSAACARRCRWPTACPTATPRRRMVALTFDDGPSGRTPAILRVLAHHHAHATFFVVGRATRGMEPVLRHIAASGNELADHTYSHANLLALRAPGRRRAAAVDDARLVARATGVQPRFFRPPYGATGPAVNRLGRSLGLIPVLWSVDSRDWQLPGTKAIVQARARERQPGAIVLMHDGGGDRRETLRALPAILRALARAT